MSEFLDERRTENFRQTFYDNIYAWHKQQLTKHHNGPDALIEILNKESIHNLLYKMTAEDERIIKALAGPNSYTIYKMLLAKRSSK